MFAPPPPTPHQVSVTTIKEWNIRAEIELEVLWNKLSFCMKHGSHRDIIKRTNGNRVFYCYFLWWRTWAEEEEERIFVRANEFRGNMKFSQCVFVDLWFLDSSVSFQAQHCIHNDRFVWSSIFVIGFITRSLCLSHTHTHVEWTFNAFQFVLRSPTQQMSYTVTWEWQSSYQNKVLQRQHSVLFIHEKLAPYWHYMWS